MTAFATSPDGVRLAFECRGEGLPALVFVHGWSCDRTYWAEQLSTFSADRLVVAVDLAGHGESGTTCDDWSMARFGRDVVAVVEQLALMDAILIGHSMGGDAVIHAATTLRGRVRGLVLVDCYSDFLHFRTPAEVQERMAPFRRDFASSTRGFVRSMFPPNADPLLVEQVAEDMSSAPQDVALAAMEQTWNHGRSAADLLSRLEVPVVAINSGGSTEGIDSLRRRGIEVTLMPEAGHFPMLEAPRRFDACLGQAIKSCSARR